MNDPEGPYRSENTFERVPAGFSTIYVRDKNGCGLVSKEIAVLGYPEFFTPNADGINDRWQVQGIGKMVQEGSRIRIYDRYGKLITQLHPSDPGWDGTFNGRPLPSSDYWFRAELRNGREFKGHFSLKR
nr:T9SS type B sorting domain-containing protein [Robertkochia sp. 3YJGBD-33]